MAGRAATTGRVDGEIQEELKRPSDCWYVPVCRVWSDFESENEREGCRGPEGSGLAAEEGCEEDGPDAEEGHEEVEVWDEVQEALSAMEHEEFDATAEADL